METDPSWLVSFARDAKEGLVTNLAPADINFIVNTAMTPHAAELLVNPATVVGAAHKLREILVDEDSVNEYCSGLVADLEESGSDITKRILWSRMMLKLVGYALFSYRPDLIEAGAGSRNQHRLKIAEIGLLADGSVLMSDLDRINQSEEAMTNQLRTAVLG